MPSKNYPDPIEGLTPGTIIITEETVETIHSDGDTGGYALLQNQPLLPKDFIPPIELEVFLNDKSYIIKCTHKNELDPNYYYGDVDDFGIPTFDNNPVILRFRQTSASWMLGTLEPGTYTVSAKVPEAKSKVLSFPKGRTIVSELSRLNKAFGTVSKKKTIIGQLSDLADAAEAGKIGGGSGEAFMVHVNGKDTPVLDKTWQEIYDALKTTSVYIINEGDLSVGTSFRIVSAEYSNGAYRVRMDNNDEFTIDSSDGYPMGAGEA